MLTQLYESHIHTTLIQSKSKVSNSSPKIQFIHQKRLIRTMRHNKPSIIENKKEKIRNKYNIYTSMISFDLPQSKRQSLCLIKLHFIFRPSVIIIIYYSYLFPLLNLKLLSKSSLVTVRESTSIQPLLLSPPKKRIKKKDFKNNGPGAYQN
jgi:hypothetical protein